MKKTLNADGQELMIDVLRKGNAAIALQISNHLNRLNVLLDLGGDLPDDLVRGLVELGELITTGALLVEKWEC